MKNKHGFKVSTGITSILMIFVILSLTAFGVLSYSSANADLKLSEKNAENIENYYKAEGEVNEAIGRMDNILYTYRTEGLVGEEYMKAVGEAVEKDLGAGTYDPAKNTVTISERINDRQQLYVVVTVMPETEKERYRIEIFRVVTGESDREPEIEGFQ